MSTRDYSKEIDQFEAHYQYDATFLRELLEHVPEAHRKFDAFMPLASHRERLDVETYWIAKLAAMQVEDCGDCLQLNVRMALEADVSAATIEAVLQEGRGLSEEMRDLYRFATSVAAHAPADDDLVERIQARFDKGSLLELGLAIATAKVFPTIKRALGYTKSCRLVEISV